MLRLRTFGELALTSDAGVVAGAATQRRSLALLAILAAAGDHASSRERLQALLWSESDERRARRVLAQTLYALRRDLGDPAVILGVADLRLNAALVASDVAEFERALAAGEFERAALLYAGPFLDGVHVPDAPEFQRWAEDERVRLARRAQGALERLAEAAVGAGDAAAAARWWSRLAALDPLNGRVAVRLMESLAAAGDTAAALRHARVHEALFVAEFGTAPPPAVTALVGRLQSPASSHPVLGQAASAQRATTVRPGPTSSDLRDGPRLPGRQAADDAPRSGQALEARLPGGPSDAPSYPATPPATPGGVAAPGRWTRWTGRLAATSVLLALALALGFDLRRRAAATLDRLVVAVVPFDVADPSLALWREGLVDVLSRNLDGAGPVRTVSATRVARSWAGRADRETVRAFAAGLGAGVAVYGGLLPAGADSVRATLTVLDVASARPLAEVRRAQDVRRMDRLTDSLTVDVLRALGRVLPVRAATGAPLGSATSLEALRAFLRGEQFFRRAQWDSAVAHYEAAVAADSAFALARRRLGGVASWERLLQDSLVAAHLLRAGAANRGYGPRDSLLIAADSLAAAAGVGTDPAAVFGLTRRLFATLAEAVRLHPADAEVWFALGEARYHYGFGPVVGVSERETLAAFDRAIALDSAFAPAYIHAVELGFNLGGAPSGLRYARAYLALNPTEPAHRGVLILEPLVTPGRAGSPETARLLDTARASALVSARTILRRWPDSAETALRLSRLLAAGRPSTYTLFADTVFMRRRLAEQLAFRGHLGAAARVLGVQDVPVFAELAFLGAVPAPVAGATFARWLRDRPDLARLALPWWAARRDTASLAAFARRARAHTADPNPGVRARVAYDAASARAHLALARGDTGAALGRFLAIPDTLCAECYVDRLTKARLLATRGREREALAALREPLAAFLTPIEVVFALERARVAGRLGLGSERDAASNFAADAWRHADRTLHEIATRGAPGRRPGGAQHEAAAGTSAAGGHRWRAAYAPVFGGTMQISSDPTIGVRSVSAPVSVATPCPFAGVPSWSWMWTTRSRNPSPFTSS